MEKKQQVQQGDVWFEQSQIPEGAEEITDKKDGVFAYGEGHHVHVASDITATKFFKFKEKTYVRFLKPIEVRHDNVNGAKGEHEPLKMLQADYEYGHVNEMDHFAKLQRKVID